MPPAAPLPRMGLFDFMRPPPGTTPLPKKPLMAVVLINMTAGFQMNIIFPFVPFMVEELRGTDVSRSRAPLSFSPPPVE